MAQVKDRFFPTWYLPILIAVGFGLRLFRLDYKSLWFDEIITVHLATLPVIDGLDGLLAQGIQLTPFYHWIIKIWLVVGQSDWLVRFPSLIFSLLSIPLMYQLGKLYFGPQIGLFAAAVIAVNPFQVWYAQDARPYSMLALAAIGSMYAFVYWLKGGGKRGLILLTAFNMLGISAHYFMFLISIVQFVFILLYFKKYYVFFKSWVVVQMISALILLPWFGFIGYKQHFATAIGWVPNPTLIDPLLTIWNFSIVYQAPITLLTAIALIVVAVALLLGIGKAIFPSQATSAKNGPYQETTPSVATYQLVLLWFFLSLIVVWLLSQGKMSFYVDRYFLVITPALMLLLSIGVMSVSNNSFRIGLAAALLLAMLYGLNHIYFDAGYFSKESWRDMARVLRQEAQPGDVVVTCADGPRLGLVYYGIGPVFQDQAWYYATAGQDFNTTLAPYNRMWVVTSNPADPQHDLGYPDSPPPDPLRLPKAEQSWLQDGLVDIITVPGITTFLYALNGQPDLNTLVTWNCER